MTDRSRHRAALLAFLIGALAIGLTTLRAGEAPRPRVAILYAGGESTGPAEIRRASDPATVDLTVFAPGSGGEPLRPDTRLDTFDLVLIDGSTPGLQDHTAGLAEALARTRVVVVKPDVGVRGNVDLDTHGAIAQYWAHPSQDNYANLLRYLVGQVLGRPTTPALPPITYPPAGFYHPRAPGLFPSLDAFAAWAETAPASDVRVTPRVTVGVTVNLTSYLQKNLAHVDAVIAAIERRGHRAVPLVSRGAPDASLFMRHGAPAVDVIIQMGSVFAGTNRPGALARLQALDVPVLSAFHHHSRSEAEYAESPTGLLPTLGSALVEAEREARTEPMVVSGRGAPRGDSHFAAPYAAAIEWRVDRAIAHARLRHLPNAAKRVVFTYWSQGGGKANVGGDPDDFLDVPATLVTLLREMQSRGYDVGTDPLPDRDTLVRRMAREASNVGTWAPGELAARVRRGLVHLVPERQYLAWFAALPSARRAEIEAMWGPPPGKVGLYVDPSGARFLVVPGLTFGNVAIAPNPDWGYLQDAKALMSTGALPPHHQYVAFFLWMQKTWRADAWVSLFSNLSLQGGKPVGPLPDDHVGVLLGTVPHLHPERLGANGGLKNTRKVLARTTSWYSLVRPSGSGAMYVELRGLLQRWSSIDDDALRREAEQLIRREVVRSGLGALLGTADDTPIETLVASVQREIDRLDRTLVPAGSKVLGHAAEGDTLVDMVTAMLGPAVLDVLDGPEPSRRARARALVREVVIDGRPPAVAVASQLGRPDDRVTEVLAQAAGHAGNLAEAGRELDGLLAALDGRWLAPGPMDDPLRRADAVPPGRSIYNFDSAEVPTPEAEALGVKQAEALIAAHRAAHGGAWPTSLAFAIFSGEIAKNRGVTEAQILHLLGTRAVRDTRGVVTGVELIPRDVLGRPRIDVLLTTSGTYRDQYPDVMALIARASRLAAASEEPDNPVRAAVAATEATLRAQGTDGARAAALARARVFAPAPGAYSPSIQFLAKSGDQRGDERTMAELYTSRLSHAYGDELYGVSARQAFERQLARVDAASFSRSGTVNGLLDHPMSAGFLGGLNLAARHVTGRDIDLYISDLRDQQRPSVETASREIGRELRTRYFNRSWVAQMQTHGYEGARTFMYLTDHLDLWDTTATQTVSTRDWDDVKRVYVDDALDVGMDRFFERHNPHAQQVLLGNLLGAATRGHWVACTADLQQVATRLARSVATHGIACEANMCRNPALTRQLRDVLGSTPDGARLMAAYDGALAAATSAPAPATPAPPGRITSTRAGTAPGAPRASTAAGAPTPPAASTNPAAMSPPTVTGRVLEQAESPSGAPAQPHSTPGLAFGVLAIAALTCVALGWIRGGRRYA